jgi:hypothetical protein
MKYHSLITFRRHVLIFSAFLFIGNVYSSFGKDFPYEKESFVREAKKYLTEDNYYKKYMVQIDDAKTPGEIAPYFTVQFYDDSIKNNFAQMYISILAVVKIGEFNNENSVGVLRDFILNTNTDRFSFSKWEAVNMLSNFKSDTAKSTLHQIYQVYMKKMPQNQKRMFTDDQNILDMLEKVIVAFSNWKDEEVKQFLINELNNNKSELRNSACEALFRIELSKIKNATIEDTVSYLFKKIKYWKNENEYRNMKSKPIDFIEHETAERMFIYKLGNNAYPVVERLIKKEKDPDKIKTLNKINGILKNNNENRLRIIERNKVNNTRNEILR